MQEFKNLKIWKLIQSVLKKQCTKYSFPVAHASPESNILTIEKIFTLN